MARGERLLLLVTPILAMAVVAVGLRVGAGSAVRAAVVYGAPPSKAGLGLAWQVVTFDEDHGVREPVALPEVEVTAVSVNREAHWRGATNDDGVAEMLLSLPSADAVNIEVRADGLLLARGDARFPPATPRATASSAWTRFARREGGVALDVTVLGQRVASGFPATIWARASDSASHVPLSGATITPEHDGTLSTASATAQTDTRGWAQIVATPMGHAVALVLDARSTAGATGMWAGALFVSPGAAQLVARPRYGPTEEPTIDVVAPNVRTTAYVEIDDAQGRAWAAALPLRAPGGQMPRATVRVPALAPGLYWAVTSGDPAGGAGLGPGTSVRPFFVAASDDEALALGTDAAECQPPRDPRETARVVGVCLALAGAAPVPRWIALDGFSAQRARDARKRAEGLALALGAIAIAMLLEAILLLRAAHAARVQLRAATSVEGAVLGREEGRAARFGPAGVVSVAILVALLGFALLAAFLVRAS
jgi:hypothetical protein